ncbi:MAG: centriole protein [Monoraphidium minutum]|nr:MAG: centriole protein [Monoraphidium minutum]
MPPLKDDDTRVLTGFDLQTASTLYWKGIPVLLKQHDREDQVEQLTFRILSGVTRQNHNLRVLRIHASSEDDPFFLHTLEVSEEDFQCLKADQGILVDFANFPAKIISLLERCLASHQSPDMPRFQAVLSAKGGDSVFKVVETNDFKQLPHITLTFRPGNDTAVKQFLAFRLGEVRADCSQLTEGLAKTQSEREGARASLADAQQQLSALQQKHARQTLQLESQLREQAAAAHEERLKERGELRAQMEREVEDAERRGSEAAAALSARVAELDADNRQLREAKYCLDTRISELSHKLGAAEGCVRSLDADVAALRGAAKAAAGEAHELEIRLADARAKLAALEEKSQSQAQVAAQQQARLSDLEGAARQWEERCSELREALGAHEQRLKESAAEVLKGNQIIEKLQSDLRLARDKVKRKQAILVRQEEEVAARDGALAAAQREGQQLQLSLEGARQEAAALAADNSELRAKLEESRGQLTSNEQMIRWLNQQVTDAQLQVSTVPGSRYQFRPSGAVTSASPAALLTGGLSAGGAYGRASSSRSPAAGAGAKAPLVPGLGAATASSVSRQPPPSHLRHASPQHHSGSSLGFSPQTAPLAAPARGGGGGGGGGGYGVGGSVGGLSPERGAGDYVYA